MAAWERMAAYGSPASRTMIPDISTWRKNLAIPRQPIRHEVVTDVLVRSVTNVFGLDKNDLAESVGAIQH